RRLPLLFVYQEINSSAFRHETGSGERVCGKYQSPWDCSHFPVCWGYLKGHLVGNLLGGFWLFVWQFSERVTAYLKFDYNTLVEVEHQSKLTFPGVTICNYNRFYNSRIAEEHRKHLDRLLGFSDTLNYYDANSENSWEDQSAENWDDDFNYELFTAQSGFRLNDSLLRCEWKGKKDSCSADNFTEIFIPGYGICFQFNIDDKDENRVRQTLPGAENGLSILIDIKQEDYTETFKQGHHEAGLKFVVHHWNDPPLVESLGFAIAPEFHTYAAVRKKKYESLPKPWGKCESVKDGYNKKDCLRDCRRDHIVLTCDCRPLGYPGNTTICTLDQQTDCVAKALQEFRSIGSSDACKCPTSCTEVVYRTSLSMTSFPSDQLAEEYQNKYGPPKEVTDKDNSSFWICQDLKLRKNLVYLDVYFEELSETKFKQVEAMSFSALLSDLGGQMGLFLGVSAITAAEIMEYLLTKIFRLFKGKRSNDNKVIALNPST
ncbi:acid-sensing ion channel 1B-like, partial [Amphiura filiformis]|uniref:acid-sensing ion channel 1B-like n=1 Tax=Amphiura filiformis TaxID=82378 RepID=UPI003B210140